MAESGTQITVTGDVRGSIVVGDHNVVVSGEQSYVTVIQPDKRPSPRRREQIELPPRRTAPPQGRDRELDRVVDAVETGSVAQVYGPAGIGKSTLIRSAAWRLSGQGAGTVFLSAADQSGDDLAQSVFEACYDAPGYRPSQVELRRLMSGLDVCLVVDDLELPDTEREAFLQAVPDARLLYSAADRSLRGEGVALGLTGLDESSGLALLEYALDRPLRADELPAARELWQVTGGSPLLLLRAADDGDGFHAPPLAEILDRLSGPARELVQILAYAGTSGADPHVLERLAAEPEAVAAAIQELTARRVVLETEHAIHLVPGALETARDRQDTGLLERLANRLIEWVEAKDLPPTLLADHAALLVSVIDATTGAGLPGLGARLAQAAAPVAACSLRMGVWERILRRGKIAAANADDRSILAYLTHEDGIRSLVTGKRLAAATAIGLAVEIWHMLGDTAHTTAAHHAQALAGSAAQHAAGSAAQHAAGSAPHSVTAASGAHEAHLAHMAHESHLAHVANTAHAGGAHTGTALTGKAAGAKAGMAFTTKAVIGGVATVAVAGTAVAGVQTLALHQQRPVASSTAHVPAGDAGPTPTIAYATDSSVMLRTGAGPARVLGSYGSTGIQLAWSSDGTQVAWLAGSSLNVASVKGGAPQSWSCQQCTGLAFLGNRAVSVPADARGGPGTPANPQLLAFTLGQPTPTPEPISGIPTSTWGTRFVLVGGLPSGGVLVDYGDAGGSNLGGGQLFYRIDAAGHAVQYGTGTLNDFKGPVGSVNKAAVAPAGDHIALSLYSRGGACGGVEKAYLIDTASRVITIPTTPSGGGPDGFWVEALWFDRNGTAYASLIPNLSDCSTTGAPPTALRPPQAKPIVCKLVGGTWITVGEGEIQDGYARNGWIARQTGTVTDAPTPTYPLTISRGTTSVTIPNVTAFAWSP